jgi:hypothetical protein
VQKVLGVGRRHAIELAAFTALAILPRGPVWAQAAPAEPTIRSAAEPPPPSAPAPPPSQPRLARIWTNEPALVRLARDHFGPALTEIDARFFAAVATGEWADFRPAADATYDATEPASWNDADELPADRIEWLCTDAAAARMVPSRGVWLRGVQVAGQIDLFRGRVPFSLTFYDCLLDDGMNLAHAELQELDLRNSCSATIQARGVKIAENAYLNGTAVFGGLDFTEARIGGDFDCSGGLVFHGRTAEDVEKAGVAIDLYDAQVGGDVKLGDGLRALGQARLIGAQVGRSLHCTGGRFSCPGGPAVDARRATIGGNALFQAGCVAEGGLEIRRARIAGDLDCDGGRFLTSSVDALNADLANVGGQVHLGDGFHAEGEVRLINAVVAGDIDCDNGEFIHPQGDSLSLDGASVGRSLRMGADLGGIGAEEDDAPQNFLAQGTVRLFGTKIEQDLLGSGGEFRTPEGIALLACNVRVGSRVVLTGIEAEGTVNLVSAQIEHELDFRGSRLDGRQAPGRIALSCNGMAVHGHAYCSRLEAGELDFPFHVEGEMSAKFATIDMHWDFTGARFVNPAGNALDASDARVGGYVNLDTVAIDGRVSFSRAKIDGVWILLNVEQPERLSLDLRFAHIWVIKDERLADWPAAGKLHLEGLVYDHFDDASPLDVDDRIAWLARQYGPAGGPPAGGFYAGLPPDPRGVVPAAYRKADAAGAEPAAEIREDDMPDAATNEADAAPPRVFHAPPTEEMIGEDERGYVTQPYTQLSTVYQAIGQDEQASRVLVARAERLGQLSPPLSAHGLWYRYIGRLIGYGYEPFRAVKIGAMVVLVGALVFAVGNRRHLMAETKLAEQVLSQEGEPRIVSVTYPRFNPLVYSLDVFLPFVDLQQICYWLPGEKAAGAARSRNCLLHIGPWTLRWSAVLRAYFWFQTLAGWTLTTLLAAAVTGIVKS